MKQPRHQDWLDEAIARTTPGRPPRPDFEAWRQRHPQALASLKQRAQRRSGPTTWIDLGRRIMRSPITKLTVAAAVIVGLSCLAGHLLGRDPIVPPSKKDLAKETVPGPLDQIKTQDIPLEQEELALAKTRFEAGDVQGLLVLLEQGGTEARVAAADYLGLLGDRSSLPALHSLAERWSGPAEDNPYQRAVDRIESRTVMEEPNTPPARPQSTDDPNTAPKTQSQPVTRAVETAAYQGLVRNEAGEPVEAVRVWGQSMTVALHFTPFARETFTDAEGRFSLAADPSGEAPVAAMILYFDHADYARGWVNLDTRSSKPQTDLDVTLYAPATVAGVVSDTKRRPIPGATVEAMIQLQADRVSDPLFLWSVNGMAVYTDDQGRFQVERLPTQARLHLKVSCDGYGLYSTQRDYQADTYPIPAGDQDIEVVLEPGGFIKGRIVYEDGQAYTEPAIILVESHGVQDLFYVPDEQGRFTITGLAPGTYRLHAMSQDQKTLCAPMDVPVTLDGQGTQALLMIRQGKPVQVRVVDENTQRPLSGIWVYAQPVGGDGPVSADGRTDAKGVCELNLLPGPHLIKARGWQAGQFRHYSQEVTVRPDTKDLTVEIAISPRPLIRGQLINTGGTPVQGTVWISGDTQETDPNGEFAVPEPFGDLMKDHLCYVLDQAGQTGRAFFWRKSNRIEDLTLVLEPLATVAGRVVGPDGTGLGDVRPQVWTRTSSGGWRSGSDAPWNLTVEQDGTFVFTGIPVGLPIDIHAEKPGFQGETQVGDLISGETVDVGDITLRGIAGVDETTPWTAVLNGRVIDEKGEPVVGYKVNTSVGTKQFQAVTDHRGGFSLKDLPEGKRLSVGLYVAGYGHCYQKVTVDGNDLEIQIFPQGWDLLGKEAPPLSVSRWFNHEPVTLQQFRGRVVLLQVGVLLPNYSRDLLLMQQMFNRYTDKGLKTIAIHQPLGITWAGKVTEADIEQYLLDQAVPFIFCLDRGPSNGDTYAHYDVKATPALYLIDKQGRVRISPTRENLEEWIQRLIAE